MPDGVPTEAEILRDDAAFKGFMYHAQLRGEEDRKEIFRLLGDKVDKAACERAQDQFNERLAGVSKVLNALRNGYGDMRVAVAKWAVPIALITVNR